jgi:hypothetical protein
VPGQLDQRGADAAVGAVDEDRPRDPILARQLADWSDRHGEPELAPGVLLLGVAAWTRMHGIVSLEIEGVFKQLDVDPARLYDAEVDHLIAQRAA